MPKDNIIQEYKRILLVDDDIILKKIYDIASHQKIIIIDKIVEIEGVFLPSIIIVNLE